MADTAAPTRGATVVTTKAAAAADMVSRGDIVAALPSRFGLEAHRSADAQRCEGWRFDSRAARARAGPSPSTEPAAAGAATYGPAWQRRSCAQAPTA